MADLDITENDAVFKFETHTNLNADIDEDLIDYDSDDALGRNLGLGHATNIADTQTLDANDFVADTAAALADASEPVKTSQGYAPLPGTTSLRVGESGQQEIHATGEQVQDYENFDDFSLEGDDTAEQAPTTTGPDQARGSIHEIDYEDDGFTFDAPAGGRNQHSTQGAGAPIPQVPESAVTEAPAKHYEIDWEDDEESVGYGTQDGTAQGGTEATAAHAYAYNVGEQESFDSEDEAAEAEDPVTAQEPAQTEPFPAITVQYRGEEFPMISLSSDGFFSDVSILDENMKAVLDGLRAELAAEIGPHDDLVFQVDKLGLEFSESSPSDTLSEINLRQMLEIHDILVKNKDFDNSRILYTYLFTRPNTIKRYEFLVESTTGDKGLAEVMHLFQPPSQGNTLEATGPHDDYEEQLDSYESTGDDATARISHGNSEFYEDAAFMEDGYDHNDDYQDDHAAGCDEEPVDPSTGDRTTAADDNEYTECPGSADPEPGASHDTVNIDDANDDAGHGDVSELFDPAPVTIDDEHFLGTITGGGEDDGHIHDDSAHNVGRPGGERVFDHRLDPDLIDYLSAGDKNVGDDDLLANLPNVGNSLHSELADYGAVDDKAAAGEEGLIDYESVGDDNEGAQHGAGKLAQTSGEDVRGDENEGSAEVDGRHVEFDDVIDYSADSSGDKYATADNALANPEVGCDGQVFRDISQVAAGDHIELGESPAFARGPSPSQTAGDAHAHAEGSMERLLDVEDDKPEMAAYADWEGTQVSASAGHHLFGEGGLDTSGTAGSSTSATLRDIGDAASTPGDVAPGLNPSGTQAEAVAIGLQDNPAGGAADAQPNLMKRAYPGELDGDDGNGKGRNLWSLGPS